MYFHAVRYMYTCTCTCVHTCVYMYMYIHNSTVVLDPCRLLLSSSPSHSPLQHVHNLPLHSSPRHTPLSTRLHLHIYTKTHITPSPLAQLQSPSSHKLCKPWHDIHTLYMYTCIVKFSIHSCVHLLVLSLLHIQGGEGSECLNTPSASSLLIIHFDRPSQRHRFIWLKQHQGAGPAIDYERNTMVYGPVQQGAVCLCLSSSSQKTIQIMAIIFVEYKSVSARYWDHT